jgi:ribosomal protein L11 methylase PrmA
MFFNCSQINPEEISEFFFDNELPVSVEVRTDSSAETANHVTQWSDLISFDVWETAVLRSVVPVSFNHSRFIGIIESMYPRLRYHYNFTIESVPEIDWISKFQQDWPPFRIGNLTVFFPWHLMNSSSSEVLNPSQYSVVLEGGSGFGTGKLFRFVFAVHFLFSALQVIIQLLGCVVTGSSTISSAEETME